ncbi:hypothetical protein OAK75_08670 [Bacteriovoracales bacterium]|nr:hypothetical protein [Bacteriovoracales bacterium]
MEDKKPEICTSREEIIKEQLTGMAIFCLGLALALPAILNCN